MSSEDIVERRRRAGETWITLAAIPFQVSSRFYGQKKATVLRTVDGKAFRLVAAPNFEAPPKGLAFLHEVMLEKTVYHLLVAPAESQLAKTLQGEPIDVGHGAPVLMRKAGNDGDGEAYAIRRTPQLDSRPIETSESGKVMPVKLQAEIERIAKQRNVPVEVATIYVIDQGLRRIAANEKFAKKKKQ